MSGSQYTNAKALFNGIKATLNPVFGENESEALAQTLIEERLGYSRMQLIIEEEIQILSEQSEQLDNDIKRILNQEPIQYVLGTTEFYGRPFLVEPGVLIPRPETEELVNLIVKENKLAAPRILDIGTGSGCIAVSLAAEIPNGDVGAWDISKEALAIAKRNSGYLEVSVSFEQVDILTTKVIGSDFDIIVSNPPYVLESEKALMQPNVLQHEPELALFVDDTDPLIFYRTICEFAANNLVNSGALNFEINESFGTETKLLMESHGFVDVEILKDLNGKDRMARGKLAP